MTGKDLIPLTDRAKNTLRMLFAAAAVDERNALSAAMRGAILMSLQRSTWVPDPQAMPQTWGLVNAWYEGLHGPRRQVVHTLKQED